MLKFDFDPSAMTLSYTLVEKPWWVPESAIWDGIAGGDSVVHGIKIDVQGMELDALRGMRRLLSRHRPKIVLEIHRDVPRNEVLTLLEDCGYLVDNEPIDDSLGAFADPQSNASFVFQANPFRRDERTTESHRPRGDRTAEKVHG